MKNTRTSMLVALLGLTAFIACSKKSEDTGSATASASPDTPPSPATDAPAAPASAKTPEYGAAAAAAGMSGTITVEPDPVAVCEKTGVGTVKLSWTATGADVVELRVGAPDGAVLSMGQGEAGVAKTGEWVKKGTVFYLQNVTGGAAHNLDNTLAKLEIGNTVTKPCK